MPRLPLVDPADPHADPHARALLGRVRELRGRALNVHRAIGNHPEVLDGVLAFGTAAYLQNSLTPAQRELAYLGASVANDCHC
jgi:alkylhydroperoxidase/carboxymuconolactone decarboxylase family protein YurZ